MSRLRIDALRQGTFRASPSRELVLFDRLSEGERRALEAHRRDADFYGVVRPRQPVVGPTGGESTGLESAWAESTGADLTGAESAGAEPAGAESAGADLTGAESAGAEPAGAELTGAEWIGRGPAGSTGIAAARAVTAPGSVYTVDRETALLLFTLTTPGPLPAYVSSVFGDDALPRMAKLVADGVLEIHLDGAFVSGPAALALLQEEARGPVSGSVAALSVAALRYGAALELDDPLLLSARLYRYNRRPITPHWQRRLASVSDVQRFLGIEAGGRHRASLDRSWETLPLEGGWLRWRNRALQTAGFRAGAGAPFKLYISPTPEALETCFGAVIEALAAARAPAFKVGADPSGLLRPDKLVAYFRDLESLAVAADGLAARLEGTAAQGVPFTAPIDGDGLLSWGVDPPDAGLELSSSAPSWRLQLTHRLSQALIAARRSGAAEPWRFALQRLELEGLDTETWKPGAQVWLEQEVR